MRKQPTLQVDALERPKWMDMPVSDLPPDGPTAEMLAEQADYEAQ
jgi:hypothetical protein